MLIWTRNSIYKKIQLELLFWDRKFNKKIDWNMTTVQQILRITYYVVLYKKFQQEFFLSDRKLQ